MGFITLFAFCVPAVYALQKACLVDSIADMRDSCQLFSSLETCQTELETCKATLADSHDSMSVVFTNKKGYTYLSFVSDWPPSFDSFVDNLNIDGHLRRFSIVDEMYSGGSLNLINVGISDDDSLKTAVIFARSQGKSLFLTEGTQCHKVKFITLCNGSAGPFSVEGIQKEGNSNLAESCYKSPGNSCEYDVCGERLEMEAKSSDRWVYRVEVDGKRVSPNRYINNMPKDKCDDACCKNDAAALETDQTTNLVETFDWPECHDVKFITLCNGSVGPFVVEGIQNDGFPAHCHNGINRECEFEVCSKQLTIRAETGDRWVFRVEIDGLRVSPNRYIKDMPGVECTDACCEGDAATLETDQTENVVETWDWPKKCHSVKFITLCNSSPGPFVVEGIQSDGFAANCHNKIGAECEIDVCSDQLTIRAETPDRWTFRVEIDGREVSPDKSVYSYNCPDKCCTGNAAALETDGTKNKVETWQWPA